VSTFETFPEQAEAKRLLRAALAEGPVHAYLFHGPAGVGKRRAALAFAGDLLAGSEPAAPAKPSRPRAGVAESTPRDRVARETHPDLYVLELVGDQIRIDEIRALRRDLHMRPFEADRRVYLIPSAHLMNDDAADATRERMVGAEAASEAVRQAWRDLQEFNLSPPLALEALFVRLRLELAGRSAVGV
jgi:DNA polymerase-3 subunit delta'